VTRDPVGEPGSSRTGRRAAGSVDDGSEGSVADGVEAPVADGVEVSVEDPDAVAHDAHALHTAHVDATVRAETAREGLVRASRLGDDLLAEAGVPAHVRRPPLRLRYPRTGWREAVRVAVERRMWSPSYLRAYRRLAWHRARARATGQRLELQGLVFTGRGVELHARPGFGRLVIGPWCWIGDDNMLRSHEGQLTLGAKVVLGRQNVVNSYLDVEIGDASILADWIYVCDFDHRTERLDLPIKDQGIVTSPTRIGEDVWIGQKGSVLRGVDIGRGAVIASHCLVRRDIPPFAIAVGVPARVVRSRLPDGMDPEEGAALLRAGRPIPGDPLEG
jgi:acetyltransferase-like isoleucine patch superfamily enzyme